MTSGKDSRSVFEVLVLSIVLVLGFLPLDIVIADGPPVEWEKTFGGDNTDYGPSVQQTSDGGYIIAGYTTSYGAGASDVYLLKIDPSGNMEWQKTFGGTDSDFGKSVQQTSDGGYIISGTNWALSYGGGVADVYLVKTDPDGNMEWQRSFGGRYYEGGESVKQTSDGGYIIASTTWSYGPGHGAVYVVKTDTVGNIEWQKTFGGSYTDRPESVQQTTDGGYIIAGYTTSYGAGVWDVYLLKIDPSGNMEWQKTFGGTDSDHGQSVQQTSDGGYIIAGYTWPYGAGAWDVYMVKTDPVGNMEWYKTFGGSDYDAGYSVRQCGDGGYIITGHTSSYGAGSGDVYVIKTDSAGNMEWENTFGGEGRETGRSVQQTSDGGYIIAGSTNSYGAGSSDVYLVKLAAETPGWSFVHMTDTHIGAVLQPDETRLAEAIHQINHYEQYHSGPKPELILVSGDVGNYGYAGFSTAQGWICTNHHERFLEAIQSLDEEIREKVYVVPGNHDRYDQRFGNNTIDLDCYNVHINPSRPTGTKDLISPNDYYFEHNKGLLFVGLDSGNDVNAAGWDFRGTGLTDEQMRALEGLDSTAHKIIFMHHPVVDVDNDLVIANNRVEFIDYCKDNNVKLVLTGHTHRAHIFDENASDLPPGSTYYPQFIQTPSTGVDLWGNADPYGYRIIDVQGGLPHPRAYTRTEELDSVEASLSSPANLHIYDSFGRHVGSVGSNEVERSIPNSFYFSHYVVHTQDGNEVYPEKIIIFDPCEDYIYKVVGTETGTYQLEISSSEDGNDTIFEANGIPTLPGSVHQYTIDWDALSQGQNGVTVTVDVDGDGEPEKTIISDNVLTSDEFDTPPIASAGGPYMEKATSWLGASVDLDGSGSSDPDGDEITYEWDLDLSVDSDGDGDPNNDVDAIGPNPEAFFYIGQTKIALVVVDEYGVRSEPDTTTVTVSVIEVGIDIKPGSLSNAINLGSHGVIPVAFLSDSGFDASTIDPATVTLRGEDFTDGLVKLRGKKDAPVPMSNLEDVDEDGDLDLVVHLETEQLAEYELEAICELGALTYEGYVVSGSDTIRVVPE